VSELRIDQARCTLCGACVKVCPVGALSIEDGALRLDESCMLCGACVGKCPVDALSLVIEEHGRGARPGRWHGVWVFAEHARGRVHPVVFELIGRGRDLADRRGAPLAAVVLGAGLDAAVRELSRYPVNRILTADAAALADMPSDSCARVLADMIEQERPEIVLCGATAFGRAFIPRVAALARTGLTADCTALDIDPDKGLLLQTRPAFGGNIMATIVCPRRRPQMATVRPKVLPAPPPGPERPVEVVRFRPADASLRSALQVIESVADEAEGASIAEADVIVAGGRGAGGRAGFDALRRLADALGGAVGASRAAVDAGWIPYAHQVGQTGKTVQPRLYVACGISGAVQHLVGMQSSGAIIAINRDPLAPIFKVADVGLVGDVNAIVPRLIEAVNRRRKGGAR
jgi:electron transfer flavoprotein alpha subunit